MPCCCKGIRFWKWCPLYVIVLVFRELEDSPADVKFMVRLLVTKRTQRYDGCLAAHGVRSKARLLLYDVIFKEMS